MAINFETDEVLRIAERIEQKGREIYRKAAAVCTSPDVKKLLMKLAGDEDIHRKVFKSMRETSHRPEGVILSKPQDQMVVDYIETFADEMIFGGEDDPVLSISSDAELEEVLDIAIRKEMESVMFYLGMKEAVRDDQARRKVDQIIWEELSHYAALKTELARLRGKLN